MQSAAFQLPERKTKRKQNFAHSSAWHLVCKICLPFGRAKIAAPWSSSGLWCFMSFFRLLGFWAQLICRQRISLEALSSWQLSRTATTWRLNAKLFVSTRSVVRCCLSLGWLLFSTCHLTADSWETLSLCLGLGSFNGNYQNAGRTKSFPRTMAGKCFAPFCFCFGFFFLVLADFPKSRKSWLKEQLKCRQSQSGQVKHKNEAPKTKKTSKIAEPQIEVEVGVHWNLFGWK